MQDEKKNEQQMLEQITALQDALQEKQIRISVAGSIAEAALSVTNIFSTAQMAADLYLQEISRMKEETAAESQRILEDARRKASIMISNGTQRSED